MAKKVSILCVGLFVSLIARGQTDTSAFDKFYSEFTRIESIYRNHYINKEYDKTVISLEEVLSLINKVNLTDEDKVTYERFIDMMKSDTYYNLSCSYSLMNKKKQAVDAFENAVKFGYKNYRHALSDKDLDNIRKDKKFTKLLQSIKEFDNLIVLQKSNGYKKKENDSLPLFSYESETSWNLQNVRAFFNLDSVAGNGDELSKIINILNFIHNSIRHDGGNFALCEFDAIDIYNYHKSTGKGVNCRHLAIALNEMYLSMGIKSRYVTCMPQDPNDNDCHVINSVYSQQLNKWIWIDPSFNAYVKDEKGNFLGIAEVRDRLINNQPLVLNEDANHNNETKQTKEEYLENYMAKNLYWFLCIDESKFNPESRYRETYGKYIALVPEGFVLNLPENIMKGQYITNDPNYFWQLPK